MIYLDIILTILELLGALLLFILAGYAAKVKNSSWRLLYFLPLLLCLLLTAYMGADICMLGVYLGSVLMMAGFIFDKEKTRKISCAAAAVLCVTAFPLCSLSPAYRTADFVEDFEHGFASMKEHYILAEHKGIDWDALYDEYLPMFEEANRTRDEVSNSIAWLKFTAQFHDGHTSFMGESIKDGLDLEQKVNDRIYGSDYGLSLMMLSDGSFAAVNVDEKLAEYGIRNGTIITGWDGMDILEAAQLSEANETINFADEDNERFWQALYAAGVGGDTVDITFIAADGSEQTVTLSRLGSYTERAQGTIDIVNRGVEVGNLEWAQVSDNTACLRIKSMMSTAKEEMNANFSPMQSSIKSKLAAFEEAGCDRLIIDMRSNGGGSGAMVKALAELFAPEGEHFYANNGVWDEENGCYARDPETGRYIIGSNTTYIGQDIWKGKPIVILVNAYSASAADHLTKVMCGFENVTVMGFNESNGSAQGIGSVSLETGTLAFSSCLILDENGDIFIDSDAEHQSTISVDVLVPFDADAVTALFDNDEDYVLNYALDYLNR